VTTEKTISRDYAKPFNVAVTMIAMFWQLVTIQSAHAEGSFQVGLNQPFVETNATAPGAVSTRDIIVDIFTAGEVINISGCGAVAGDTLSYVIETPSGTILPTVVATAAAGKISCTDPMTAAITTAYKYTTAATGKYKIRLINTTATNFSRFDVTVTSSTVVNPDPSGATGIRGRVSSLVWSYSTGAFSLASATNANYYVLAPGGFTNTNYVWQLDLNQLAGNAYTITSNSRGVAAPRSGFSTDITGNSVTPQYPVYLNYPMIAFPVPSAAAAVSGFRFIDSAGQDYGISPGGTAGIQDTGNFEFTTNAIGATYAISIDVNKNGIFGDAGDVVLGGAAANGFNQILWDGKNNAGVVLPTGSYQSRVQVRLGEFHFIANDVETSGGTGNGLTIFQAASQTTVSPTQVYWDDITILGAAAGGTSNTPLGALSGTTAGYHTWGTFDAGGGGFGNNRFVDTYAYGATTIASFFVAITPTDVPLTGANGVVTITPTSMPGNILALSVTDADLNSLPTIVETMLVSVKNNISGEIETVTLTETGVNTGIFTGSLATTFGAIAGANDSGTLNTQAADTITVTYNDALSSTGTAVARTATDTVSGGVTGIVSITPTSKPGDTLTISVADADLNTSSTTAQTVVVTAVNAVTGESEQVTLTETGPNTGSFSGALVTATGATAGANNSGTMNTKSGDTVVVTYNDAKAANGGPAAPTATDTVTSFNPLVATNDSVTGLINPPAGLGNVVNAFTGDTVNGITATSANGTLSVASGSTVPSGLTFDITTGNVSVNVGTTAGTYSFTYQICESVNLANCKTAIISVTVVDPIAVIVTSNDTATGVNGVTGAVNIVNAFAGDTINGAAATTANAVLTAATAVPTGLTFDLTNGNVSVAPGTAAGIYSFDYKLCETVNPTNCKTATVSVTVAAAVNPIIATTDSVSGVNGVVGAANVVNAFTGDTINGAAATTANAVLSVASGSTVPLGLSFDTVTGNVSVAAGTAPGTYSFNYQICESANLTNCQTATISVTVGAVSIVVATTDSATGVNGATGATNILNAFTGDTVNGAAATTANATLSVASGSVVPAGLIFDTATGNVSVSAGTATGTYSFNYQICETSNRTNCQTATISVTVDAAPVVATSHSASNINGASGAANVINSYAANTINGAAATTANSTLSVATGSTVPTALTFDTATGNVSVAAGTPAGVYSFDYQICEILNPTNCQIATNSVTVVAAPIVASADSVVGINGASGAINVVNAFTGDTVNGAAATNGNAILSAATAVPSALIFETATGNVSVASGSSAGVYSFDYRLCEALNPGSCATATISVTVVAAPIVAASDTATGINGASGAVNVVNTFTGDTVNGVAATAANSTLSLAFGATVPTGLTFDIATGNVSVAAGTPAGVYSFDYQLCELLNPRNCTTATISVTVVAAPITAASDTAAGINGASGAANVVNAFTGDTVNGAAATAANSKLSLALGATVPTALTFDTTTGNVSVVAGTPAGSYSFDYQICEALNPTNCKVATITVTVIAAPLFATADSVANINGANGGINVLNAFTGDTVNRAAATALNAVLSIAPGSTVPAGLTFDTSTGNISVAAGTPAGTYSFDYQICEALNPTNCKVATIAVTVAAAPVVAANDTATDINGASGAVGVLNIFDGDTINGLAANNAKATLRIAPGSTVPSALVFDADGGNVSVAAGTPAGTYSFDYQLCERLNPTNCAIATVSVTVVAAQVTATADSVIAINGASGASNVLNAFTGDTVNGAAATRINAILSAATAVPSALTFDTITGDVSVVAGTPAGAYSFDYKLCEILNPTNCKTATISVTVVAASIIANADSVVAINGASGAANVLNAFNRDTVNGVAATTTNAILTAATAAPPALAFDTATGNVSVAAGTPAGIYSFDYQLCEALNPTNCTTATISVTVDASVLVATPDTVAAVNGASGSANVVNVLTGDTVNGVAATPTNAILSAATALPSALTFDTATGNVSVAAGTPAGTYSFDYQLCEALNPTNCTTSTISVTVVAAPVTATADSVADINGASGATNVVNAFTGDTVNGAPATATNAILTAATAVPSVLNFDTATGNISVAAGTPAGVYNFDYKLCEALNPMNCKTATISVTVVASALSLTPATVPNINGASGTPAVANAFSGNTINGVPATPVNTILTLAPGTSVPAGLTFDPSTGVVGVAAGTSAGIYEVTYQLCEALNPTNCKTATITVTVVAAPVVASADSVVGINGASGAANVVNAFTGDTINGASATAANTILSVATTLPSALMFDTATGNISIASGTPAGIYSFEYQICEILNPTNCSTATISVTVVAAPVVASPDTATDIIGAAGATNALNAFGGDTVNGAPANASNAFLTAATAVPSALTFDIATGTISVAAGTPAGVYSFDYQICETLNPANCATATISVTVVPAPLVTTNGSVGGVNGATGAPIVANSFTGNVINGVPATPATATLVVATGTTVPAGLTFDSATGNVGVPAGTAAGTYTLTYQICETLNPTNCQTATIVVTVVAAPVAASGTTIIGINGASGAPTAGNIFASNTINGVTATPASSILSVASGSTVPAGLTFDPATGNVAIAAGTAAGTYSFEYQICEALNPTNCKTATLTVIVIAAPVVAVNNSLTGVNGASGATNVVNALTGNMVNGAPATVANAVLGVAPGATVPVGLTFDTATGNVSVAAGTPAGTYSFDYQICEALNPTNCKTATIVVAISASSVAANPDSIAAINGATGALSVANVLAGDMINGAAATTANAILSVARGSTVPAGLIFDPATGNVGVAAGTPAGTYGFTYQICERLNPANCQTSTVSVMVDASAVTATPNIVAAINGAAGAANVVNAFTAAIINGVAATPANAILAVASGSALPAGLTFDPATGAVGVSPATPAGTYSFNILICERLNPANCATSAVSLTVVNPGPVAAADSATMVKGNPVTVNVLANDSEPGGDPLTVRETSTPAHGATVINADGTITYTPAADYIGTDSFTYTVCDPSGQCATQTVSLIVHPSVAALTGTVFLDSDANNRKDPADPRQPNWLVEVVRGGAIVATVRTDANGSYQVSDMPLGAGYSVVFRHPTSNVVYGRTNNITLTAGITAVDLDRPIDPSGVIYDSVARTPILGARVSIVDANGVPLPIACVLDASQQNQPTGIDGRYRIDIIAGAAAACPTSETAYRLVVANPSDTVLGASTIILPQTGSFDPTGLTSGAIVANVDQPQGADSTRYFYDFRLASGDPDVLNNHIPLDRTQALTPLIVTKTSPKRTANVGDLVPYTIVVRNAQDVTRNNVDVVDLMPSGFKYVVNSGRVNANSVTPHITGRELDWQNLSIPANSSVTISLVLTVGAGVNDGDYVNLATGRDARSGRLLSNQGEATVRITPSPLFDCGEIIGKVFDDRNSNGYQDKGEPGIAGARVATVNGLLITADQYGRYHVTCAAIPNAQIGSNFILKLDPRSLPSGYQITTENPRVVRLTRGKISELNFGARIAKIVTIELSGAAFEGGSLTLKPEWQAKLPALIEALKAEPSILRLNYAEGSGDAGRGSDRTKALADQIEEVWKRDGGPGSLQIERTTAQATQANGKE
jgi:large repetitive protein